MKESERGGERKKRSYWKALAALAVTRTKQTNGEGKNVVPGRCELVWL